MKLLDNLLRHFNKSFENKLIKEEQFNERENHEEEIKEEIKQSYLTNDIKNILIHGKARSGKTHLATEYYNNTSIQDKLFIAHGTFWNDWKYHILGGELLESVEDFNALFTDHKLIIIDELEGLLFSLPEEKKEKFINSLKLCIENPNQTAIITNPKPLDILRLQEISGSVEYFLRKFDLILVGNSSYSSIEESCLNEFDYIANSYSCSFDYGYNFLVYQKEQNSSFVLQIISQAPTIFKGITYEYSQK